MKSEDGSSSSLQLARRGFCSLHAEAAKANLRVPIMEPDWEVSGPTARLDFPELSLEFASKDIFGMSY